MEEGDPRHTETRVTLTFPESMASMRAGFLNPDCLKDGLPFIHRCIFSARRVTGMQVSGTNECRHACRGKLWKTGRDDPPRGSFLITISYILHHA